VQRSDPLSVNTKTIAAVPAPSPEIPDRMVRSLAVHVGPTGERKGSGVGVEANVGVGGSVTIAVGDGSGTAVVDGDGVGAATEQPGNITRIPIHHHALATTLSSLR
jgi:hypothetical protein